MASARAGRPRLGRDRDPGAIRRRLDDALARRDDDRLGRHGRLLRQRVGRAEERRRRKTEHSSIPHVGSFRQVLPLL
jgi:hypothetical protein